MNVPEIKQSLSTLTSNYLICENCKIVDKNFERIKKGSPCLICDSNSSGGVLYFKISIHILIDLIQEAYHSANLITGVEKLYKGESSHDISVIIFFCTLRESLLDNLIRELLNAQKNHSHSHPPTSHLHHLPVFLRRLARHDFQRYREFRDTGT